MATRVCFGKFSRRLTIGKKYAIKYEQTISLIRSRHLEAVDDVHDHKFRLKERPTGLSDSTCFVRWSTMVPQNQFLLLGGMLMLR
jgi:hypothetical protein